MGDLIDATRAAQEFGGLLGQPDTTLDTTEVTTLGILISAISQATINYCNRDFIETDYDEIYHHRPESGFINLNQYPVIVITSIQSDPLTVLQIQQTDSVTNQYATVLATLTGLTLTRTASGVTTPTITGLTFAANKTITAIVAAIAALNGSTLPGWTSRVVSPYGLFPSTDLFIRKNAQQQNARAIYADLKLFVNNLKSFKVHAPSGRLQPGHISWMPWHERANYWSYPEGNLRVKYTAGYNEIPFDLQSAVAQWVAAIFYKTKTRDPNTINQFSADTGAGTSGGKAYTNLIANMPPATKHILNMYRQVKVQSDSF